MSLVRSGSGRPGTIDILMRSAMIWAERSTCVRGQVGAVIALNGRIISTGYNGAPAGLPHCEHVCTCGYGVDRHDMSNPEVLNVHGLDCPMRQGCTVSVHAETNAIAFAARHGVALEKATLFTTHAPCIACSQLIINAGLSEVIYLHDYRITDGRNLLEQVGIQVRDYNSL